MQNSSVLAKSALVAVGGVPVPNPTSLPISFNEKKEGRYVTYSTPLQALTSSAPNLNFGTPAHPLTPHLRVDLNAPCMPNIVDVLFPGQGADNLCRFWSRVLDSVVSLVVTDSPFNTPSLSHQDVVFVQCLVDRLTRPETCSVIDLATATFQFSATQLAVLITRLSENETFSPDIPTWISNVSAALTENNAQVIEVLGCFPMDHPALDLLAGASSSGLGYIHVHAFKPKTGDTPSPTDLSPTTMLFSIIPTIVIGARLLQQCYGLSFRGHVLMNYFSSCARGTVFSTNLAPLELPMIANAIKSRLLTVRGLPSHSQMEETL